MRRHGSGSIISGPRSHARPRESLVLVTRFPLRTERDASPFSDKSALLIVGISSMPCPRVAFGDPPCPPNDPCITCSPLDPSGYGPTFRFAGGKQGWREGPTIGEAMRENRELWKEQGLTGDNAPEPYGKTWT